MVARPKSTETAPAVSTEEAPKVNPYVLSAEVAAANPMLAALLAKAEAAANLYGPAKKIADQHKADHDNVINLLNNESMLSTLGLTLPTGFIVPDKIERRGRPATAAE